MYIYVCILFLGENRSQIDRARPSLRLYVIFESYLAERLSPWNLQEGATFQFIHPHLGLHDAGGPQALIFQRCISMVNMQGLTQFFVSLAAPILRAKVWRNLCISATIA